ncbi:MAG: flavin reductase family protein [Synergistaceae bacterium]|jgi:flavin reductase (DIM6/NTAB) family NADH-FMN oxidoreductase RutF|nr:flavin reductase family protein [Synergistaceae bacterium]
MENNEIDPKALFTFSYGLYVVSTALGDKLNGQVADAVMQLTAEPVCVAACLHKNNYTAELLMQSKKFSISVFSEDVPLPFIGNFGFRCGRDYDKFARCSYRMTENGLPIVTEYTVAAIEAEVIDIVDVHTHRLFIGEVRSAQLLAGNNPLTYADYHKIRKGKSHANAPSSVFNNIK